MILKVDSECLFENAFFKCKKLKNINSISGKIKNDISFAYSPELSEDTVDRVINALYDLDENENFTLTLHLTVYNNIFNKRQDLINLADSKGWIVQGVIPS